MTIAEIQAAAERLGSAIKQTPCLHSPALSDATGMDIYCKLEFMQATGSFKERGARNALLLLSDSQKQKGVVAASAGNHALGLAWHARQLGIPLTVVMPRHAPLTKINNCRKHGAKVLLHGNNINDAQKRAHELERSEELTYINGYDHPAVLAGQGTLGLELCNQMPEMDAIILPVGGGGLLAGAGLAIKTKLPGTKIISVESVNCPSYAAALEAGQPVEVNCRAGLADGLAVPKMGENSFPIARSVTDRHLLVNEHAIALAILRLIELEKVVVEGAGATPLAACLEGLLPELRGKKVLLPLCGGNIDTPVLGRIIERGLVSDWRLAKVQALISDRPGGLAAFTQVIAQQEASIMQIEHDRAFGTDDITTVKTECLIQARDRQHLNQVLGALRAAGFEVSLLAPETSNI